MTVSTERAVLAGGCFWGVQDLIRRQRGVLSTRVGYSGGDVRNATYRNHGTHAEAVEIIFDPRVTSFRDILEFFFQIHDPSTRNRQGICQRRREQRAGLDFSDLVGARLHKTYCGMAIRIADMKCRTAAPFASYADKHLPAIPVPYA